MKPTPSFQLKKLEMALSKHASQRYMLILDKLLHHHSATIPNADTLRSLLADKRYKEFFSLADSLPDTEYSRADEHFSANQFAAVVRKYPWDPVMVGTRPRGRAMRSFRDSERRCMLNNRRFRLFDVLRSPNEAFLERMRQWIRYVIGNTPDLGSVFSLCDFGGGASLGVHGNATNLGRKLTAEEWTVSAGAFDLAFSAIIRNAQFRRRLICQKQIGELVYECYDWDAAKRQFIDQTRVVNNNKIAFVPKTAKTLRAIAVEPLLNGYLQKGIDQYLRHRLKRVGFDLGDQKRNQAYAQYGSEDWEREDGFCTIDLSSASDSISMGLVRAVLPPDWFDLLNATRATEYEIDGRYRRYHKFCSMGNGFCFPLETLLFAACVHAAGGGAPRKDYVVYGDDIVVRKTAFDSVLAGLRYLGFRANRNKTFGSGPFRESCGSDWYAGEDVRPYTLDHKLDSLSSLFKLLNLSRRSPRSESFFSCVYPVILNWIPPDFQFWRPFKGNPDSGIDAMVGSNPRLLSRNWRWDKHLQCHSWKELGSRPVKDELEVAEWVLEAAVLRGASAAAPFIVRRETKERVRVKAHAGSGLFAVSTARVR